MIKVNEFPKGIGLESNLINILGEKTNVIDFLIDFYIFYKRDIKTFQRIKFSNNSVVPKTTTSPNIF